MFSGATEISRVMRVGEKETLCLEREQYPRHEVHCHIYPQSMFTVLFFTIYPFILIHPEPKVLQKFFVAFNRGSKKIFSTF